MTPDFITYSVQCFRSASVSMRIRIQQRFKSLRHPDMDPVPYPGFDDQKCKKIYSWKKLNQLIKNCNLLIPWPLPKKSKLQEKPSALKREHPALPNLKFLHFFLRLKVHFCAPGSGSGSRSSWPKSMRIRIRNTDSGCTHTECYLLSTMWRYLGLGKESPRDLLGGGGG